MELSYIQNLRDKDLVFVRYFVRLVRFVVTILRLLRTELLTNRLLEARYPGLRIGMGSVIEGINPFWTKVRIARALQIHGSVKIDKRCRIRIPDGSSLILCDGVYILEGCLLDVGSQTGASIKIGKGTSIERFCVLGGNIEIGEECLIAPKVFISSNEHSFDGNPNLSIRQTEAALPPSSNMNKIFIGKFSWIGVNSVVVGSIELGTKTVVGANSFVNHAFPSGHKVLAGSPARPIRNLKSS